MQALLDLQRQLMQVQQQTTKKKLSDRNVVEIVQKLAKNQMIDLVMTLNGREYLTRQKLKKEITFEVQSQKRLPIYEIQNLLNVSLENIVIIVQELPDIKFIEGQLICKDYESNMAREVNDILQINGQITISDISIKYSLPSEYVKSVVETYIKLDVIKGEFQQISGIIYTKSYFSVNLAKLRGALRAATAPLNIQQLQEIDQNLVQKQIQQLIKSREISGKFENNIFKPSLFQESEEDRIKKHYQSNKYIEYSMLKQDKSYLDKHCPGGIHLDSCYIDKTIAENFEAGVIDILESFAVVDLYSNVEMPQFFNFSDIEIIFETIIKSKNIYLAKNFAIKQEVQNQAISLCSQQIRKEEFAKSMEVDWKEVEIDESRVLKILKDKSFIQNLSCDFGDYTEENFFDALAAFILPSVQKELIDQKKRAEPVVTQKQKNKQKYEVYMKEFYEGQLISKSLQLIQNQLSLNIKALAAYFSKGICNQILNSTIISLLEHFKTNVEIPEEITQKTRQKLVQLLPTEVKQIVQEQIQFISSKSTIEFIEFTVQNIKNLPLNHLRPIDKKVEKQMCLQFTGEHKAEFIQSCDEQDTKKSLKNGMSLLLLEVGI